MELLLSLSVEDCDAVVADHREFLSDPANRGGAREEVAMMDVHAYTIAAAALRWYALTETGGDDHAARQAIIAACREATR